ncbi:unnamed protein product [Lampetra fluviatilis]
MNNPFRVKSPAEERSVNFRRQTRAVIVVLVATAAAVRVPPCLLSGGTAPGLTMRAVAQARRSEERLAVQVPSPVRALARRATLSFESHHLATERLLPNRAA